MESTKMVGEATAVRALTAGVNRRGALAAAGVFASGFMLLGMPRDATAQDAASWPSRPINMTIPYPPGAITDTVGRRLAQQLSIALGVPVIAENRAGAGANLGAAFVSNAAPNGYTILFTSYGNILIDAVSTAQHHLTPVAAIGPMTVVLLVRPNAPYHTIDEFVSYARANPKKLNFASVGIGSSYHLLIEQMNSLGKLDMVHVPYRGGAASMTDFLGGRVDAMLATWLFAKPYVTDNRARAIAVTNEQRSAVIPNMPTINEKAVPGARLVDGLGVFVPKGTPEAIVRRLNAEVNRIIEQPDMKSWLTGEGMPPRPMSPADFGTMLSKEVEPLTKLIRDNNIKIQ